MSEPTREQIKEAFKKTIERWEKIVEDPYYYDQSHCHLCYLTTPDHACNDYCPIQEYGEHTGCADTPYNAFYKDKTPENALAELNFLRKVYIWWMERQRKEVNETCGTCEDFKQAKESDFGRCEDVTKSHGANIHFENGACTRWRKAKEEKKEEWVDVTKEVDWRLYEAYDNTYWLRGYYKGRFIVWLDTDGIHQGNEIEASNVKIEKDDEMSFRILKKT